MLGIVLFALWSLRQQPAPIAVAPTLIAPTSIPSAVPAPATPTPDCTAGAEWLKLIVAQEQHSQWAIASKNAEVALADPALCERDRQSLNEKVIQDGLQALYAQEFHPLDVKAQRDGVALYQSLRRRALTAGVAFPTSIQVATDAYRIGQFLLARTAFEEALEVREMTANDQSLLQQYDSTLYNLGDWWIQGREEVRAEGLQLLVASYQLDTKYKIGDGKAAAKLKEQLGDNPSDWPEPVATPLLQTQP